MKKKIVTPVILLIAILFTMLPSLTVSASGSYDSVAGSFTYGPYQGVNEKSGTMVARFFQKVVNASEFSDVSVTVPDDYILVGGSAYISSGDAYITGNYPVDLKTWRVVSQGTSHKIVVSAIGIRLINTNNRTIPPSYLINNNYFKLFTGPYNFTTKADSNYQIVSGGIGCNDYYTGKNDDYIKNNFYNTIWSTFPSLSGDGTADVWETNKCVNYPMYSNAIGITKSYIPCFGYIKSNISATGVLSALPEKNNTRFALSFSKSSYFPKVPLEAGMIDFYSPSGLTTSIGLKSEAGPVTIQPPRDPEKLVYIPNYINCYHSTISGLYISPTDAIQSCAAYVKVRNSTGPVYFTAYRIGISPYVQPPAPVIY